jgi:hypothetical protein
VRHGTARRRNGSHIQFIKENKSRDGLAHLMVEPEKLMNNRIAAAVAALVLGVAPLTSAMALPYSHVRPAPVVSGWSAPLGTYDSPFYATCPMNSAAEGNANQQNFPVKQYGQTAGGNRC